MKIESITGYERRKDAICYQVLLWKNLLSKSVHELITGYERRKDAICYQVLLRMNLPSKAVHQLMGSRNQNCFHSSIVMLCRSSSPDFQIEANNITVL